MRTIIGIDPGASGGIAWFHTSGKAFAVKMPDTDRDILDVILSLPTLPTDSRAAIEKVAASVGRNPDGSKRTQGVASAFKFGRGGALRMALTACGISFDEVPPKKWQAEFGLLRLSKSETITEKKNRHKAKAQQLFPYLTITHATADALLIAEWLRRRELESG